MKNTGCSLIVRYCAPLAFLLLASCKGIGLSNFDMEEPLPAPGLSSFDTQSSEDVAKEKWFDSFYGSNHGWGWSNAEPEDPNCSFYNTCKGGAGGPALMNDPTPENDSSGW